VERALLSNSCSTTRGSTRSTWIGVAQQVSNNNDPAAAPKTARRHIGEGMSGGLLRHCPASAFIIETQP
jgi:hypothetical protein